MTKLTASEVEVKSGADEEESETRIANIQSASISGCNGNVKKTKQLFISAFQHLRIYCNTTQGSLHRKCVKITKLFAQLQESQESLAALNLEPHNEFFFPRALTRLLLHQMQMLQFKTPLVRLSVSSARKRSGQLHDKRSSSGDQDVD